VPLFRHQRRSPPAPCAGLQPRQLHAHAGAARGGGAVVADQPAGEADQNRRQDRQTRPLGHVPDGRGRGDATDVPGNPGAHRATAGAARACVTGDGIRCDIRRRQQRCALITEKERGSALRGAQPEIWPPTGSVVAKRSAAAHRRDRAPSRDQRRLQVRVFRGVGGNHRRQIQHGNNPVGGVRLLRSPLPQ
jgi:hypothetical protein